MAYTFLFILPSIKHFFGTFVDLQRNTNVDTHLSRISYIFLFSPLHSALLHFTLKKNTTKKGEQYALRESSSRSRATTSYFPLLFSLFKNKSNTKNGGSGSRTILLNKMSMMGILMFFWKMDANSNNKKYVVCCICFLWKSGENKK